jgi:hypothetical protein
VDGVAGVFVGVEKSGVLVAVFVGVEKSGVLVAVFVGVEKLIVLVDVTAGVNVGILGTQSTWPVKIVTDDPMQLPLCS